MVSSEISMGVGKYANMVNHLGILVILASHCPEVDTRWKHDDRNFHIRL